MGTSVQAAKNLRSISDEIEALNSEIQRGEPLTPESNTIRGWIGRAVKRLLHRLLWWHSYQIKTVTGLISQWTLKQGELTGSLLELQHNLLQEFELDKRRHSSAMERHALHNEQRLTQALGQLEQRLQTGSVEREQLAARLAGLEQSTAETIDTLLQRIERETGQTKNLAGRLADLGLFAHQTRASLSVQDRRLALFMEETLGRLPEPSVRERLQTMLNTQHQHQYDELYASFEDLFRGSREEIKARQTVYLPRLLECGIGSAEMPVLDLGCGRGEWLELLGEQGYQARGVDSNEAMIERCESLGLPVVKADALPHLRALPDSSLGAVTSFHMVEHMPFDVILTLVDESLRVLKPGGMLILETPNPANVLVGAYTFHFDPTHLKPLPSQMLRFFVEARGFCDVSVLELHPRSAERLADDGEIARVVNYWLFGPQDYAIVARRP